MDNADDDPQPNHTPLRRDCTLTATLQTRPSDFDREFVIRYSAIADLMQDIRSVCQAAHHCTRLPAVAAVSLVPAAADGAGGTTTTTSCRAWLCKTA
eukprot:COSAG02_NODE_1035_length_15053_cov_60.180019_12_plen_97_part_00